MGLRACRRQAALSFVLLLGCLQVHAQEVGEDNVGAIKGARRVAIAQFGVEFYTHQAAEGKAGLLLKTSVAGDLKGVTDQDRQEIADQAYADTVKALADAGFEVVPASEVMALPAWQAYAKNGKPAPMAVRDGSIVSDVEQVSEVFSSQGMPAFFSSSTARGDFSQRTFAQNAKSMMDKNAMAKSLDAVLLDVHYLAAFGTMRGTRNGSFASMAGHASASIDVRPVLLANETEWQFNGQKPRYFGGGMRTGHAGAVYLKVPLETANDLFATDMKGEDGFIGGDVQVADAAAYKARYEQMIATTAKAFASRLATAH